MAKAQDGEGRGVLTDDDRARYDRQIIFPGWGEDGQEKLKGSTVFVAGAGGLGSSASIYLAAAGVGKIKICDFDSVELSNLNRQILHSEGRVGMNKAISAGIALRGLNSSIEVESLTARICDDNIGDLVGGSCAIVDCMDNFPTRYVLNRCAVRRGIPLVHGSIWGMGGYVSFLHPPETPCLRCVFPEPPPQDGVPVVGAAPGVIGALQALEVIKYLTGIGGNLKGRILVWDGEWADFNVVRVSNNPECPDCGRRS
ncbi:MAG: HesA/MoeB/ThiF family protein [bacterium]